MRPNKTANVLHFIIDYKTAHDGVSPTHEDICRACDISSKSAVSRLLDKLESAGKIRRLAVTDNKRWGIVVAGGRWTYTAESAEVT